VTTPDRRHLDALLDLVVYAPVGFATSSRELLPELVAKGREQVDNQVRMARALGQLAVTFGVAKGRKRLASVLGGNGNVADTPLTVDETAVPAVPEAESAAEQPAPARAPRAKRTRAPRGADEQVVPVRRNDAPDTSETAAPAARELAIPGYDSLAASQVVARLEGLTTVELEQVRRYEQANRNRRTILGKVAQLEGTRT
jgi:hypothetical protein